MAKHWMHECGISWSYSLFGSLLIFQGILTSIAEEQYRFVILLGWGWGQTPDAPSGSPHVQDMIKGQTHLTLV